MRLAVNGGLSDGGQPLGPRHRLLQALDEDVDGRQGGVVLGLQGQLRVQVHQGHDLDGLAQIVEDQQVVRQHQPGFRHGDRRSQFRQPLDVTHHIITQVPYQSPPKPGQAGGLHRLKAGQQAAQVLKGIDPGRQDFFPALSPDGAAAALHLKQQGRIEPQETETAPLLAALDALQQKRTAGAPQFLVGRHRGFQVPQDLPVDRDQVALPGQVAESGKIGLNHTRSIRLSNHLFTADKRR